jgi:dynein heavy chain
VLAEPLLIGDYKTANPADADHVDPKLYEECGDFDDVSKKFNALMLDYNDTDGF